MYKATSLLIQFSFDEFALIYDSFNELCNGFRLPDFEKKIGVTETCASDYRKALWPVARLMRNLQYRSAKEALPKKHKCLADGYTAYWHNRSRAVVFESPAKQWIVYQPEKGGEYFDELTAMELPVEDRGRISLLLRLGEPELKLMLAMARETFRYVHEKWGEYHTRLGATPEEGEQTMDKLRKEIDRFSR